MRTYGRLTDKITGAKTWVVVETDVNGFDDDVWITTLVQVLKLSPGESPFYGNYGIPARQSVVQQVMPDYYVALTQSQFAGYFANLTVAKTSSNPPTYSINVIKNVGSKVSVSIAT